MTMTGRRVGRALADPKLRVTRSLLVDEMRVRAGGTGKDAGRIVDAYCAVFMVPAEIVDDDGHYEEQVAPTAFTKTLQQRRNEIFCIYNHGRSLGGEPSDLWSVPLGQVLDLKPDRKGLLTSTRYNPDDASDRILEAIKSGSLRGMSFTGVFLQSSPEATWFGQYREGPSGGLTLVTRQEIALIEYGPTPIPAYEEASVTAVRSRSVYHMTRRPRRRAVEDMLAPPEGAANPGGGQQRGAALGYGTAGDPSGSGFVLQDNAGGADTGYRAGALHGHAPYNGMHEHAHPSFGGPDDGDGEHLHAHVHHDDNAHNHDHHASRASDPRGFRWDPDNDGDDDSTPGGDRDHSHWSADGRQIRPVPGRPMDGQSVDDQTGGVAGHRSGPTPDPGYGLFSAGQPGDPQGSQVDVTGNNGADVGYRDGAYTGYGAPGPSGPGITDVTGAQPQADVGYRADGWQNPGFDGNPEYQYGQNSGPVHVPAAEGGIPTFQGTKGANTAQHDDSRANGMMGGPEYPYGDGGTEPSIGMGQIPTYPGTHGANSAIGNRADGQSMEGLGNHDAAMVTHTHPHPSGAGPDLNGDGVHAHPHTHYGENLHAHGHDMAVDNDHQFRAGYLGYGAPAPNGPGQLELGRPTTSAGVNVGYSGSGGTPSTNAGDVPFYHGTGPTEPPNAWTQQRDKNSPDLQAPNSQASTGRPGDDLYPQSSGRASDDSSWDASRAWHAASTAKNPSSAYHEICAGRRTGDPSKQSSWALPHHYSPGGPANTAGVRNALARLPQTQGLVNRDAAEAHLQAHLRAAGGHPAGDGTKATSSSGRNPAAASATPRAGTGAGAGAGATARTTGPHSHPAASSSTGEEMDEYGQPVMSVTDRRSRAAEIRSAMARIDSEWTGSALPPDVEREFNALYGELQDHERNIVAAGARANIIAGLGANPQAGYTEGVNGEAVGYADYPAPLATQVPQGYGDGNGGLRERSNGAGGPGYGGRGYAGTSGPALVQRGQPIWDLGEIRQRAHSFEDLPMMYRDQAMRAVEWSHYGPVMTRETAQERVAKLLRDVDDKTGTIARRILTTGSPVYERAFGKLMEKLSPIGLSQEESRALALGTDSAGGYAVPFQLDPTVILASNGVINPLRQIARIEQITGKEWDGVTSTGVTVSRVAEGAEAGSADASFIQPKVRTVRVMGFVPFNIELDVSWAALRSTMTSLLMDAKDVEEATSFLTGSGTAPNANGLFGVSFDTNPNFGTAHANQVTTNSGTTSLQIADIYNIEDNMPPRFRAQSSLLSSKTIFNTFRQLFQQQAAFAGDAWVHADAGQPARMNGYPAYEASQMQSTLATNNYVFVQGDFQQFIIVDRIGMGIELVPQLFGSTNRYPTGQRGILAVWFNNCQLLVPNAFRALRVGP